TRPHPRTTHNAHTRSPLTRGVLLTSYGFRKNWGGVRSWRPVGPTGRGRACGGPSQGAPMSTGYLAGDLCHAPEMAASLRWQRIRPQANPAAPWPAFTRGSAAQISAKYP